MRQACWYEGIYIIQRPVVRGMKNVDVKLDMDIRGQIKKGKHTYKQNSIELENKITEAYEYCYKRFILGH
jgi:hypothetical protein